MKKSLLTQALRIARTKLDSHPELENFPHYSFIIQAGKIVEYGTNTRTEPPKFYGYHRASDPSYRPKYHAELNAFKKARGLIGNDPFEIINIRLNKFGDMKLSKPCKPCYELMNILGCRKYYYSSDVGFLCLT